MFVITEDSLKGLIAPITPYYSTPTDWLQLEEGKLSTYSEIYRTQPHVRSVVEFIADHCARVPARLVELEDDPSNDVTGVKRTFLRNHPGQKIVFNPNPSKKVAYMDFWRELFMDFLIYDRSCIAKIRKGGDPNGEPIALVRIPPVWFTPFGHNYWWPESIRLVGNRAQLDFRMEDVIYIHGYDPIDPRMGVSPMQTLKGILEEEAAAAAWRQRFWTQGVQQSMIISRPEDAPDWDDDARDRFIESLRAAQNRGKPLLLEEGMTANPASGFDPKSAEYIQGKRFTREESLRVYNMPVGLFEQNSASGLAQYRAMLYSEALAPRLGRWWGSVQMQLLTDWFDADEIESTYKYDPAIEEASRGSLMEQITVLSMATGAPFMLRSEARGVMGLESLAAAEKADKLIVPMNVAVEGAPAAPAERITSTENVPIPGKPGQTSSHDATADKPANQNGPAKPPTANEGDSNQAAKEQAATAKPAQGQKARPRPGTDKERDRFIKEADATLRAFVERQKAAVLSKKGAKLAVAFDQKRWNKELSRTLTEIKKPVVDHYGQKTADRLGTEWDYETIADYVEDGSDAQAENMNTSTADGVKKAVDVAGAGALFDRLLDRMSTMSQETVDHMASFASATVASYAPGQMVKQWVVNSNDPRPTHAAMDGETVDVGQSFSNGLDYPHDPTGDPNEVAGCMCTMDVFPKDEEGN